MNRLIFGLNKDAGGDIHIRGGQHHPEEGSAASTLARFISVVRHNDPNARDK